MSQQEGPTTTEESTFPFSKAASELQTEPHLLWRWSQRFALFLGPDVAGDHPHYSETDLETLRTVLVMQDEGFSDPQIAQRLALRQAEIEQRAQRDAITAEAVIDSGFSDASALTQAANGAYAPVTTGEQETLPRALRDVFQRASGRAAGRTQQSGVHARDHRRRRPGQF